MEVQELRYAQGWINQDDWDASSEGIAWSSPGGTQIDLRLDWGELQNKLASGAGRDVDVQPTTLSEDAVNRDYDLDRLDPTQRSFADRTVEWANESFGPTGL